MGRAAQVVGSRRPRLGAMIAVGVVALGAGGVGWATTRSSATVITACANDAHALFLSTNGSCPSGQTLVRWAEQGPQGPPGAQGANGAAVVAWGPASYRGGFSIRAEIENPGKYWIDGSVRLDQSGFADFAKTPPVNDAAHCELLKGPPNGGAGTVGTWTEPFVYIKSVPDYWFPPLHEQIDVASGVFTLGAGSIPLELYFSCKRGAQLDDVWSHPTIDVESATSPNFHQIVGPALPKKPSIGPGPIHRVFGTE
jgi:hypothetical protein